MTTTTVQKCPSCESEKIVTLQNGKVICKMCGYQTPQKKAQKAYVPPTKGDGRYIFHRLPPLSNLNSAKIMFVIGFLTMLGGAGMTTTSCSSYNGSSECVHNIGLLNSRSNTVNIGGFLMVSGAVLSLKKDEQKKD